MLTTLHSRLARITIPAVLVTGSLAVAHPAAANDYCVGQISCVAPATWVPSLDAALAAAAAGPNADHIILSGGTFTASSTTGWSYDNASGPVEITGAGRGNTILTGPAPLNRLLLLHGAPGSAIRDLSIQLPAMDQVSTGVLTNATVERVDVTQAAPAAPIQTGVGLLPGGVLTDSTVTMYPAADAVAVGLGGGTVRNSVLNGATAVLSSYGGAVERSWLTGTDSGLTAWGGATSVENSVVRVNSATGNGLVAYPRFGGVPAVNADGLTVISGFGGGHVALEANAKNVGQTADISLKNSILRGFDIAASADSAGGVATINTSWSDYDTTKTQTTGNATISKSNISYVANPGFVNPLAGNFRLASNSPLIDAGDPATTQGLDMDGNPRVTDGNLDATARRDIGAYEVPGPLPQDPPAAGEPQGGGSDNQSAAGNAASTPVSGSASAASPDTVAPVISGLKTTKKAFAVGRARTAISALVRGTSLRYSLSEAAKVTVTIKRSRDGNVIGKLTRAGAKGSNAVKFSGRIGKRALKAGRYVAALTATDAAGNRSAAKRVSFRVVAG
jgi:hypothetical protein